jgi:hypothetical protein
MSKIVFLADYYRRLPWLRDEDRFVRRFAAGMATGIGSGWLVALTTALWLSDDDAERERLGALVEAYAAAEDVDSCELLDETDAHEGAELRDWSIVAGLLSGFVAREVCGEDTSEPRAELASAMHALSQRRWLADAHAVRQRRLERQRQKRREAAVVISRRARGA